MPGGLLLVAVLGVLGVLSFLSVLEISEGVHGGNIKNLIRDGKARVRFVVSVSKNLIRLVILSSCGGLEQGCHYASTGRKSWSPKDFAQIIKTINQIQVLDVPGDVTKGEIIR